MRMTLTVGAVALVGLGLMGQPAARAQSDSRQSITSTPLTFRLATTSPVRGFEKMTLANGRAIYVSSRVVLAGNEVVSTDTINVRGGSDVDMALTAEGSRRLADAMNKYNANQLAIFQQGQLLAAGSVDLSGRDGTATISGLSEAQASQLTGLVRGDVQPLGAAITLVASQTTARPGDIISVDVFARGVSDVRTYQVALETTGGRSGRLELADLSVDHSRPEYIFGASQKLDAVDRVGGRIGGVLMSGGVDVSRPGYLGTFLFQVSDDAAGSFTIGIETKDGGSLLQSSRNETIAFSGGRAVIQVGKLPGRTSDR